MAVSIAALNACTAASDCAHSLNDSAIWLNFSAMDGRADAPISESFIIPEMKLATPSPAMFTASATFWKMTSKEPMEPDTALSAARAQSVNCSAISPSPLLRVGSRVSTICRSGASACDQKLPDIVFFRSSKAGFRSPRYLPVSASTVMRVPAPAAAPRKRPGSARAAGATAISPAPRDRTLPVRVIIAADSPAPAIASPDTLGVRVSMFLVTSIIPVLRLFRVRPPERLPSAVWAAARAEALTFGTMSTVRVRCRIASATAAFPVSASALMVASRSFARSSRSCFALAVSALALMGVDRRAESSARRAAALAVSTSAVMGAVRARVRAVRARRAPVVSGSTLTTRFLRLKSVLSCSVAALVSRSASTVALRPRAMSERRRDAAAVSASTRTFAVALRRLRLFLRRARASRSMTGIICTVPRVLRSMRFSAVFRSVLNFEVSGNTLMLIRPSAIAACLP